MCPFTVSLWSFIDFVLDSLVDICWERADLLAFRLTCAVLLSIVLMFCSFPVWCLGKELEFDCIGS